jgi:hypothetical protein
MTILIVAPRDDTHANALAVVLKSEYDSDAVVWDIGTIPTESHLDFILNGGDTHFRIRGPMGRQSTPRLLTLIWIGDLI